jgi:hypothetical protein
MSKIFALGILIMIGLAACGSPAPDAAPTTAPTDMPTAVPTVVPTIAPTETPAPTSTSTPEPPVDSNAWYRWTNKYLGGALAVDFNNIGSDSFVLQMVKVGFYSGQFWQFQPWGDGTYKITCQLLADKNRVLDVGDDGRVIMALAGTFASQHWSITPLKDGSYRLTHLSAGDGWSLAITDDGRNKFVMSKTADDKHQYWIFIQSH